MGKLILLRHGESVWNRKNIFSGWVDIPLSQEGIKEAECAGKILAEEEINAIYVSNLIRAQMTACIVMAYAKQSKVPYFVHSSEEEFGDWYKQGVKESDLLPVQIAWQLNERMYGELQGKNKEEIQKKHGKEQVQLWRRSFAISPPNGESLEQTANRVIPYFQKEIKAKVEKGDTVFVCAHGNSLRAIVMHLESLSSEEVLALEIATGKPRIYAYREKTFIQI